LKLISKIRLYVRYISNKFEFECICWKTFGFLIGAGAMGQIRMDSSWFDARWGKSQQPNDIRRQWERLGHLSQFLDEQERVLFEAVAEQGGGVGRLARLTRRSPSSVSRQIRDIVRRLSGRELRMLLAHPDEFSGLEQACVREHLVRKRPLAQVARELGTTVYEVRKTLSGIRAKTERLCRVEQWP
jgi:hypothetical protein